MKYWQIILFSFLIGCLLVVTGLLILHAPSSQAVQHHPANDMVGVAYGLAIAFNIVLALGSIPVLALKSRKAPKLWQALALLFALPLVFTIAVTWSMDFYALFYCLPYLCSVAVLFGIRMAQQRNKPSQNIKTADPTTDLKSELLKSSAKIIYGSPSARAIRPVGLSTLSAKRSISILSASISLKALKLSGISSWSTKMRY